MAQLNDVNGLLSAESIKGLEVLNPEGEKLGQIEEIYLDLEYGRIAYAVLGAKSGFMGMGALQYAVPWQAISWTPLGSKLVLNLTKDALKGSPTYDRDSLPFSADRKWLASTYSYYGFTPYWTVREEAAPLRNTELQLTPEERERIEKERRDRAA